MGSLQCPTTVCSASKCSSQSQDTDCISRWTGWIQLWNYWITKSKNWMDQRWKHPSRKTQYPCWRLKVTLYCACTLSATLQTWSDMFHPRVTWMICYLTKSLHNECSIVFAKWPLNVVAYKEFSLMTPVVMCALWQMKLEQQEILVSWLFPVRSTRCPCISV